MLREAMELREQAAAELAQAQADAAARRGHDLHQQRSLLSALLDDVIQLQGQAERLARRVADALDEIEADMPTGPFRSLTSVIPPEAPTSEQLSQSVDSGAEQGDEQTPSEPAADDGENDMVEGSPTPVVVLVHGVPRAATAKSLQRYLSGLDSVTDVAPREFAGGELRLQVTTTRPLQMTDLHNWADGRTIEPIHERADLIEVRLASDFGHPASHPG
ncbi:MAG TPA: hypothetical protein VFL82_06440 [Thermomicrobiales bacterium]|nr:hypothetical protein [Thermomicrobiales bacterium]